MNIFHKIAMVIVAVFAINMQMAYATDTRFHFAEASGMNPEIRLDSNGQFSQIRCDDGYVNCAPVIIDVVTHDELPTVTNGVDGQDGRDGIDGINGIDGRDGQDADMSMIANFVAGNSALSFANAGGAGIGFGVGSNGVGSAAAVSYTYEYNNHSFSAGATTAGQFGAGYKFKF